MNHLKTKKESVKLLKGFLVQKWLLELERKKAESFRPKSCRFHFLVVTKNSTLTSRDIQINLSLHLFVLPTTISVSVFIVTYRLSTQIFRLSLSYLTFLSLILSHPVSPYHYLC